MTTVRRGFTLDDKRDADIIAKLDAEENVSAVVRQALREHYDLTVSLNAIYQMTREILKRLEATSITVEPTNEDPDLAAAVDDLGL
jgi:hypothetical protein